MAQSTSIYKIFEKHQYNLEDAAMKSKTWFTQQALLLQRKRYTPNMLIKDTPSDLKARVLPGRLYMFQYDPKTKEQLPYYDRFPLVIPFRIESNGFYGINFHYLPYYMRIKLLDRLMVFATSQTLDEQTRLKLSYQTVAASARFAAIKPCVKMYLKSQMKSLYKEVPSNNWATAMLLPVERFRKAQKDIVWNESRKTGRF